MTEQAVVAAIPRQGVVVGSAVENVVTITTQQAVCASFAEENDIDLIVLPSHGRSGLKRMLIGSVTERVLRLAHRRNITLLSRSFQ